MTTDPSQPVSGDAQRLLAEFEGRSGLRNLPFEIKERPGGAVVVISVIHPNERLFKLLGDIQKPKMDDVEPAVRATLRKRTVGDLLKAPEAKLLLRTISESLTVNRHTFGDEFFARYIKSVFQAEERIVAAGNHVIFGRRGSGKSSLLLYGMRVRAEASLPYAWVDMQVYAQRDDDGVICDIVLDVLQQAKPFLRDAGGVARVSMALESLKQSGGADVGDRMRHLLPDIKRVFGSLSESFRELVVFLDDCHLVAQSLQPRLLNSLYSFARGNRIFLKLSAIETFTKLWDPLSRVGLEIPHDVQLIRLDYNLTLAQKALEHIRSILDAHAVYSGLSSVRALCADSDVLSRLVWVAAGVPRDALNIFSQAMTKAAVKDQRRVTVTNINVAASEMVNDKLRDIERDASGAFADANSLLAEIRDFCIKREKKNAFLVEIVNDDPVFNRIRQLIDLRLLHVIHEGITRHDAGRKFMALILDYGFYIGMRKAKSVDLFNRRTEAPKYNELRELPVFRGAAEALSG